MFATVLMLAAAAAVTETAALDAAAAAFAGAPVGEAGGPLSPIDARLRLSPCSVDPELSWRSARRDAIVILCPDAGGWRLFVPVRLASAPSAALVQPAARPQPVIRRGDPVAVVSESAGFTVSTDGVAMGDAAPGGRLQVRIEGRRQPIHATAVEPGRATVPVG